MRPERRGAAAWVLQIGLGSMLAVAVVSHSVLPAKSQPATADIHGPQSALDEVIRLAPQQVKAGEQNYVTIDLKLPTGYLLTPRAPLTYRVALRGEGIHIAEDDRQFHRTAPSLPLQIPFQAAPGRHQATLDIDLTFAYCRKDNTGVCALQSVRWRVPLQTIPDGVAVSPVIPYLAEAPDVQQ